MSRLSKIPPDHPAFAGLPVSMVTVDRPAAPMAVHMHGRLGGGRLPLICLAGYQRNMADYADFLAGARNVLGEDWPIALVDLRGRGRSGDRKPQDYGSPNDATDVAALADALGIGRAVFLGQGYGGQVVMALAAKRPALIAGAVLIDAGPVSDPRGLVRLRINLKHLDDLRGAAAIKADLRQILANDYPGTPDAVLDRLGERTHFIDKRGRAHGLFDKQLQRMLESFEHDDVLVAQWPLFDALNGVPLLLLRSQMTDLLRRETFDEMMRRRPDAEALVIAGQGSPALLDQPDEIGAIADFIRSIISPAR